MTPAAVMTLVLAGTMATALLVRYAGRRLARRLRNSDRATKHAEVLLVMLGRACLGAIVLAAASLALLWYREEDDRIASAVVCSAGNLAIFDVRTECPEASPECLRRVAKQADAGQLYRYRLDWPVSLHMDGRIEMLEPNAMCDPHILERLMDRRLLVVHDGMGRVVAVQSPTG